MNATFIAFRGLDFIKVAALRGWLWLSSRWMTRPILSAGCMPSSVQGPLHSNPDFPFPLRHETKTRNVDCKSGVRLNLTAKTFLFWTPPYPPPPYPRTQAQPDNEDILQHIELLLLPHPLPPLAESIYPFMPSQTGVSCSNMWVLLLSGNFSSLVL